MYLTRLVLDLRSAQARRDLADAYQMHRTLTRAFVRSDTDKPPRFLWAMEAPQSAPAVLVQSESLSDWGPIQGFPYLTRLETKEFNPARLVREGARYRFRLVANPVITQLGKRRGIVGESAQLAWLQRQGARHGFALESAVILSRDLMESTKDHAIIRLQRTMFEGVLKVERSPAMIGAMASGVGHGKAFGCGLLLVRRAD